MKKVEIIGADVNKTQALFEAIYDNNLEEAKRLIKGGVDVNARGDDEGTPLAFAAYWGNTEAVELLIELGADIEARNRRGRNALIWAAMWGRLQAVDFLLKNEANKEVKDNSGLTALDYAIRNDHPDVVKILEVAMTEEEKALFRAIYNHNLEEAKRLLENGVNIEVRNTWGVAPLMLAAICTEAEIMKLLIEKGAKIEAKDKDGKTALDMAVELGTLPIRESGSKSKYRYWTEVIELLIKHGATE